MTTGHGRVVLRPLTARASSTVSAAVATASGKAEVVGFAPEVNVTNHVLLDTGRVVVSSELLGSPTLTAAPPQSAERLLCYLLPMHRRDEILGDLAEDYRTNFLPKYGLREARRMYWSNFIRSVATTVPPWIWAAILGAVGWLWSKLGS